MRWRCGLPRLSLHLPSVASSRTRPLPSSITPGTHHRHHHHDRSITYNTLQNPSQCQCESRRINTHAYQSLTATRPGDQHRDTHATTNPFVEQKPHVTEFTAQEIATLQSRLEKQLGPEYISTRPGNGGGKVHYLAAEKVINLANEVFGFNGWSSAIQNVQIDFVDENPTNGKITLGLSTIVRVTLRDGTFHEDIGYGHIENCKGKAAAFEKAKKEAATDALKRALRNFGNVLGNCLYDKDYLAKVQKIKIAPSKWDADNLHRHPDFAPIKKESIADAEAAKQAQNAAAAAKRQPSNQSFGSIELEDEFGGSLLDETDFSHPDEVLLHDTPAKKAGPGPPQQRGPQNHAQQQGVRRMHSMPQIRPPNIQPPEGVQNPQAPQRPQGPTRPPNNAAQEQHQRMPPPNAHPHQPPQNHQRQQQPPQAQPTHAQGPPQPESNGQRSNPSSATANNSPARPPEQNDGPRMPPPGNPEGFVTGRNADLLNQPAGAPRPAAAAIAFNPHADSPSLRRTQGVNPGKSAPVMRSAIAGGQGGGPNGQSHAPHQQQQQHQAQSRPQSPALPGGPNGMNGATTPIRTNYVNPSADPSRRIGMPHGAGAGAIQNRGGYRPPGAAAGVKRPPLSDVSNLQQMDGAADVKKAKADGDGAAVEATAQAETA